MRRRAPPRSPSTVLLAGRPDEPRILLLVDGFPAFRSAFEGVPGRAEAYRAFQQVLTDGRGLGIHVALTADRGQSVPTSLQAMIQRRIVLRMADEDGYALLGMPRDILGPDAAPGRAIVDDHEAQIAVIGGTSSTKDQSLAIDRMAEAMTRRGTTPAPGIRALPVEYGADDLPATTAAGVAIGLSDLDLGPYGIEASGTFIVAGSPGAGRSTAAAAIARQTLRARPDTPAFYIGDRRSPVQDVVAWTATAESPSAAMAVLGAVDEAADRAQAGGPVPLVVLEGIGEFATSIIEMNLSTLVKRAGRGEVFFVVVGEMSEWTTNFGLLGEIKAARRGVVLQPETIDGEVVLKTPFPRLVRGELPVGRGILAHRGKTVRIQFPLVAGTSRSASSRAPSPPRRRRHDRGGPGAWALMGSSPHGHRPRCRLSSKQQDLPAHRPGQMKGALMANLNVTYDQMNSAASRLRDGQNELEANLQRLRQLVAQLVQDGFTTSRASGAFDASYTEFTTGATKTVQGIEGMASFLEKAAQALQSTDEQLASQLGQ